MPHSTRKLLLDVSLACQEIMEFTEEKSYEDFQVDRLLQLAIEREFEIIGEALFRLEKWPRKHWLTKFLNIERLSISEIYWHTVMIL